MEEFAFICCFWAAVSHTLTYMYAMFIKVSRQRPRGSLSHLTHFHKLAHSPLPLYLWLISMHRGVLRPMRQVYPYELNAIILSNMRHTNTCAHPNSHVLLLHNQLPLKPHGATLKKNFSLYFSFMFSLSSICLCLSVCLRLFSFLTTQVFFSA